MPRNDHQTSQSDDEVLRNLFEKAPSLQYKKGQLIIYQGDQVNHFFYIKSGYIRAYIITDEGDERTLIILKSADIFPLLKDPEQPSSTSLYFYETMEVTKLGVALQEDLLAQIKSDRKAAWTMFRYISKFSGTLASRIQLLESKTAEDKVIQLFDYLITVCGEMVNAHTYKLKLKLTHQDIANLVGYTRETASIAVKKLEEQGIISYQDRYLVIKKSGATA